MTTILGLHFFRKINRKNVNYYFFFIAGFSSVRGTCKYGPNQNKRSEEKKFFFILRVQIHLHKGFFSVQKNI